MAFADDLARWARACDAYLPRALDRVGPDCPPHLREAMAYSLMAPGKRLRPILTMLACQASGGGIDDALPAAAAVEMVHAYSLIHDDLPAMDDDDWRRGRPTCHKQFDEATAILAGDALLTLAFQVLADCYPGETAAACVGVLAQGAGAGGMVGGQILDLAAEKADFSPSLDKLQTIHRLKTGALFRACVLLGWHAAPDEARRARPEARERLEAYIDHVGLLFQITDDLLDVEGTSEAAGKAVGKDAARGKLTYPGLLGVEESRRRARDLVERAVAVLDPLGASGAPLAELARTILRRDR